MTQSIKQDDAGASFATEFHPIIIGGDNGFCVHLPEWNVSGEGRTVEEAYRQFEINRDAFEQRNKTYGLATISSQPYVPLRKPVLWRELSLFFTKTAIAAVAVIMVVVLLLPNIGAAARYQISALVPASLKDPMFWAVQLPTKLNGRLDRMDPADAEKMNKEWGKLFDRSAPALRQLKCAL